MTAPLAVPVLRKTCHDSPSLGQAGEVVREPSHAVKGTVYCCNVPSNGDHHAHASLPSLPRRVLRQCHLGDNANGVCFRRPIVGRSRRRKRRRDFEPSADSSPVINVPHDDQYYSVLQYRTLSQHCAFQRVPHTPDRRTDG